MLDSKDYDTDSLSLDISDDFINDAVSVARLISIYGNEYLEEIDTLWNSRGTEYIVLFADDEETEYAILPVGLAHPTKSLSEALRLNHGKFHAVCHCAARQGEKTSPLRLSASGWHHIAMTFPSEARALEELINKAANSEAALMAVLTHVAAMSNELHKQMNRVCRQESELRQSQEEEKAELHHLEELVARYGKWETLTEQETLLEQRERYVKEAEERLIRTAHELEIRQAEIRQEMANLEYRRTREKETLQPQ